MRTCGLVLSFIPFGWKLFLKVSIWEATAPAAQKNFFQRTLLREKQTSHTEGFEITATPQVGILFTASPL